MIQSTKSTEPTITIQSGMTSASGCVVRRCEAVLRSSSHYPLRALRCEFHEGVLSVHGIVPTFYLIRLAQALLASFENLSGINNRVVVVPQRNERH